MTQTHSFGYWLRLKRQSLDLSRKALAEMVSYSAATIRKVEDEERRPSPQLIERLADVLSIPPEEREAFARFARGVTPEALESPSDQAPWRDKTTRAQLPTPATSLIGRQSEIAAVRNYLLDDAVRLVTLSGSPGIGKTRLSLATARAVAAADFPDGVFFVGLASIEDPALIEPTIEKALGLVESRNQPADSPLTGSIGHKRILIVLDNCEHLIDAIAPLVSGLLAACPGLKILATSRESLRVPGEWLYAVPALSLPAGALAGRSLAVEDYPALVLFQERARAVNAGFTLDEETLPAVIEICARLDGLPLAIELLAARMRLMTPQELLGRMTDLYILSADGMRGVPARQKTLHQAISWSYDALPPDEQRLFAGLAIFAGGFNLESAGGVLSHPDQARSIADQLMALLDKSLIERHEEPAGTRFSMLATIRQFAREIMCGTGEETATRDRHLAYFIALAEQAGPYLHGPDQKLWGDLLEAEVDNLRAALNWSLAQHYTGQALQLLAALCWPWSVRGYYGETRHYLDMVRDLPGVNRYPILLARILGHAGRNSWVQGNFEDASRLLKESRSILLIAGPEAEIYLSHTINWLGLFSLQPEQNIDAARALFSQALEIGTGHHDQWVIALSTFHQGIAAIAAEEYDQALAPLQESLGLFHQLGDLFFIARAQAFLGRLFYYRGDYERSLSYIEAQLKIDCEINHWDGIADGYNEKGELLMCLGEEEQSEYYIQKSNQVCEEHGLSYRHRPSQKTPTASI